MDTTCLCPLLWNSNDTRFFSVKGHPIRDSTEILAEYQGQFLTSSTDHWKNKGHYFLIHSSFVFQLCQNVCKYRICLWVKICNLEPFRYQLRKNPLIKHSLDLKSNLKFIVSIAFRNFEGKIRDTLWDMSTGYLGSYKGHEY